ncbi:MAG: hypothetical protein NTV70_16850 [Acidobacteria bacterium]|nr:hypothetical protein [Acidobacteriota bacterium]
MTWKKSTGNGAAAAVAPARVRPEKAPAPAEPPNFAQEAALRREEVQSLLEDYMSKRTPPVTPPPPGVPSAGKLAAAPIRTTPPLGGSGGMMDRRLTAIEEALARIEARLDEQAGQGADAVDRLVDGLQNLATSLRHPRA